MFEIGAYLNVSFICQSSVCLAFRQQQNLFEKKYVSAPFGSLYSKSPFRYKLS